MAIYKKAAGRITAPLFICELLLKIPEHGAKMKTASSLLVQTEPELILDGITCIVNRMIKTEECNIQFTLITSVMMDICYQAVIHLMAIMLGQTVYGEALFLPEHQTAWNKRLPSDH